MRDWALCRARSKASAAARVAAAMDDKLEEKDQHVTIFNASWLGRWPASLALAALPAAASTPPRTPEIAYFAIGPDKSLLLDVDSTRFASTDAGQGRPPGAIAIGKKEYACIQSRLYTSSYRGLHWTAGKQVPERCNRAVEARGPLDPAVAEKNRHRMSAVQS